MSNKSKNVSDPTPLTAEVVGTEEEFPADCEKQLQYLLVALQYATTAAQNLVALILEPETLAVNVEEAPPEKEQI